ncbi:MAG: phage protein Gp36 family protein [Thermoanaerobaculia bacterium]
MPSAYDITVDDLMAGLSEERLRDLTDDANAGSIDPVIADAAVLEAEDELHFRVEPYYVTPLATSAGPAPKGVKAFVVRSARWYLAARRPEVMQGEEGKYWEARRKEVIEELDAISDPDARKRRQIAGAIAAPTETEFKSAGSSRVTSDERRFTRDNMRSWGR